jgi:tetratricopeptide (TPR) repeat protein
MIVLVALASALLVAVAAAGVLAPFRTSRGAALEPMEDPLEDERRNLLRALRDLAEDRAAGRLPEGAYRELRSETETRAVAVLKALEHRDGHGELRADLRDLRDRPRVAGSPTRRAAIAASLIALAAVILAPLLAGALRGRETGAPITGDVGGSPVGFFEQRVRDHPDDVAARLDLAEAYLAEGDTPGALQQYRAVLDIDPENAEAFARVGALLFQAGGEAEARPARAAVDRALAIDPDYPEALYWRGVILERLDRDRPAIEAYRSYLDAAPFGAYREDVRDRLQALGAMRRLARTGVG